MAVSVFFVMLLTVVYLFIRWVYGSFRNNDAAYGDGRQNNRQTQSIGLLESLGLGFFDKLNICKTQVVWDWKEPVEVGQSMTFKLLFYKYSGKPFDANKVEDLEIHITCRSMQIAHVVEIPDFNLGDNQQDQVPVVINNCMQVSFIVRASGVYKINITQNHTDILRSPYSKAFIPKCPVASKTTVIRSLETFSILPVVQNKSHIIEVEPRDEFGNNCLCRLHSDMLRDNLTLFLSDIDNDTSYIPASTDYLFGKDNIKIDLYVPISGSFHATVRYNNEIVNNGDFDIVCLTPNESITVETNLAKQNLNSYYEAKLVDTSVYIKDNLLSRTLSMGDMLPSTSSSLSFHAARKRIKSTSSTKKGKKVYIYITHRQIVIKEFYFKFIPRRLQSFRLCQGTKIDLFDENYAYSPNMITISDGVQSTFHLYCNSANTVIATFFGILKQNTGGSDSFDEKLQHFNQELLKHLKINWAGMRDTVSFKVDRDELLYSSYKATKGFSANDWSKQFSVTFAKEEGLDWGGLTREWIQELCGILFNPALESEKHKMQCFNDCFQRLKDDNQALVLPRPCSESSLELKYFEFAGKLMGKCIVESAIGKEHQKHITAKFARSFLAQLIGLVVTFRHFETDDPELYKSKIRYIIENDVSDLELTFSDEVYDSEGKLIHEVALKPHGNKIVVTNENKFEYLNLLAQFRLSKRIKDEMDALMKGLNAIVPDYLLSIFDELELELVMCGSSKISVEDLQRNCLIADNSEIFKKILSWFWSIISNFTQEELARLMQFTTGCSQIPTGGFKELNPQFKISFSYYQHNSLPTAHTCFNELCLPKYDSHNTFHRMLKLAINEGSTGFGLA